MTENTEQQIASASPETVSPAKAIKLGTLHVTVTGSGSVEIWEHDGDAPLATVRNREDAHALVDALAHRERLIIALTGLLGMIEIEAERIGSEVWPKALALARSLIADGGSR